jgi:hypothetical protein
MRKRTMWSMMSARWSAGFAALLLLVLLAIGAAPASAGLYAFGGYYTDSEDAFLGAGFQLPLGPLTASPNAEYLFVDGGKAYTLNLDAHFSVIPLGAASLWVGGGMAWTIVDPDGGDSETETGINILAGANLNALPLKPFGQIKKTFMDGDDPFSFAVGVHF